MPDMTPGQIAGFVFDALVDSPVVAGISEENLQEKVAGLLDQFFKDGYPDVVAELWRRAGLTEDRVYEAIMQAADRLDRDPDLVGELVFGGS